MKRYQRLKKEEMKSAILRIVDIYKHLIFYDIFDILKGNPGRVWRSFRDLTTTINFEELTAMGVNTISAKGQKDNRETSNIPAKKAKTLTQDRLMELFNYDPAVGVFIRRKSVGRRGCHTKGKKTGCLSHGYLVTMVDGVLYRNPRLAWLYHYGYFPEGNIDHINRVRTDDRINNLREVNQICNMRNVGNKENNTSGVKGVVWNKSRGLWVSQAMVNRVNFNLGGYKSFDDAVCARLAFEQCVGWNGCESSSPAYLYVTKNITNRGH